MNNYRTALLTTRDHAYKGHLIQTFRVRPREYSGSVIEGESVGQHNTSYRMSRQRVLAELKASIDSFYSHQNSLQSAQ